MIWSRSNLGISKADAPKSEGTKKVAEDVKWSGQL
jgi:hypothetical protein